MVECGVRGGTCHCITTTLNNKVRDTAVEYCAVVFIPINVAHEVLDVDRSLLVEEFNLHSATGCDDIHHTVRSIRIAEIRR